MSQTSRNEILELLARGKINAAEAAELLNHSEEPAQHKPLPPEAPPAPASVPTEMGKKPRWFKVRVRDLASGKKKVSVNIPVRMLKFGLKMGSRFTPELDGLNLSEIESMILEGENGVLVEVEDEDSNEHVQVYLE